MALTNEDRKTACIACIETAMLQAAEMKNGELLLALGKCKDILVGSSLPIAEGRKTLTGRFKTLSIDNTVGGQRFNLFDEENRQTIFTRSPDMCLDILHADKITVSINATGEVVKMERCDERL